MRKLYLLLTLPICLILSYLGNAQNPNWTMPPWNFQPGIPYYAPLPLDPLLIGSPNLGYQGQASTNMHAGYSDSHGNLLFSTVDEYVYDAKGYTVGMLQLDDPMGNKRKRGFNQRLILPMGNSCERFAILSVGSADHNSYGHEIFTTSSRPRLYMAVYDISAPNPLNAGTGALDGMTSFPWSSTLVDISERDGLLYGDEHGFYGFDGGQQAHASRNYHIASTKLIDNCFYHVFISDGERIIRYKLTESGLTYDNYYYRITEDQANNAYRRNEMELLELPNGNYRLAVPINKYITDPISNDYIRDVVKILDFNSNFEVDPTSIQIIPFYDKDVYNNTYEPAQPIGLEFDPTGRFLYITHHTNPIHPDPLQVWDVNMETWFITPNLNGASDFMQSYIERYGDKIYLATDDRLAQISTVSDPGNLVFNPSYLNIDPGYGNNVLGYSHPGFFRYILPVQIDDGDYEDLAERSCDCCKKWGSMADTEYFTAKENATWTPLNNPFTTGESDVYFKGELRIPKGMNITIKDMNFYFKEEGIVIVEAGDATSAGAKLTLDNTLLSADSTCVGMQNIKCKEDEEGGDPHQGKPIGCRFELWQGVRVLGIDNEDQIGGGGQKQGKLNMRNASMIEYARIGVRAGRGDCTTCGGGIVTITDSKFKDNPTGLYFDPYQRYVNGAEAYNYGKVENTEFTWTADLRALWAAKPLRHVDVRESSGLTFRGNRYENEDYAHYAIGKRGTGIYAANSRISEKWLCTGMVLPCPQNELIQSVFKTLTVGIEAYGNLASRTLEAYYGKYRGNHIGISINELLSPEILNNDIRVPNVQKSIGISMVGSTQYVVENNNIVGMSKLNIASNFGIVVQSSGGDDNEVYRNSFKDLGVGILSTGENGTGPEYFYGLKWKCNTFDKTITTADILVQKGRVSIMQGDCNVGVTGPAGNVFSHNSTTIPNHYDIGVLTNPNHQINYRHHKITGGSTARLKPLRYTNGYSVPGDPDYVQLDPCTVKWSQLACPVKSSGAPPTLPLGPGIMAENDGGPSMSAFDQTAGAIYAQLDAAAAQLDGGLTEELITAIYGGADVETIAPMLEEAGGMVSERVLNALRASPDEEVQALAYIIASDLTNTNVTTDNFNTITLPSNEIENEWKSLRFAENDLWKEIIAAFQKDTLNAYPTEGVMGMLDQYQPNTAQRFVALLAAETGVAQPTWIRPANSLSNTVDLAVLPMADSTGRLPNHIDDWFIDGFFDGFANAYALNTAYIENGDAYLPYVPTPNTSDDDGQGKSMKHDGDNETAEVVIALLPNPFDETLTIRAKFAEDLGEFATLRFYDALGREVMAREIPAETGDRHIDGRNLPEGLLIYTVEMDGRIIQTGKVVKQR